MSPEEELISWVGMAAPMPKAADQIDGCNDQSADDNGLRDLLFRIAHIVGEGADHLKPQHVEYNDGDKGQTFQIEAGQKAGGRHIVCKAVLDAEVNPHHTYQQSENDLDDSADIQNKDVVADRETGDQRDDPDKGQLNEQTWHRAQREPRSGGDQIRADHGQRRHPQREVQPVPPGGAGAPFGVR